MIVCLIFAAVLLPPIIPPAILMFGAIILPAVARVSHHFLPTFLGDVSLCPPSPQTACTLPSGCPRRRNPYFLFCGQPHFTSSCFHYIYLWYSSPVVHATSAPSSAPVSVVAPVDGAPRLTHPQRFPAHCPSPWSSSHPPPSTHMTFPANSLALSSGCRWCTVPASHLRFMLYVCGYNDAFAMRDLTGTPLMARTHRRGLRDSSLFGPFFCLFFFAMLLLRSHTHHHFRFLFFVPRYIFFLLGRDGCHFRCSIDLRRLVASLSYSLTYFSRNCFSTPLRHLLFASTPCASFNPLSDRCSYSFPHVLLHDTYEPRLFWPSNSPVPKLTRSCRVFFSCEQVNQSSSCVGLGLHETVNSLKF